MSRASGTDEDEVEVLEGERKAMSGDKPSRAIAEAAVVSNTPGSSPKGKRAQAELGSRTNQLETTVTR